MTFSGWRKLVTGVLLSAVTMIAGCGGGSGSTGTGSLAMVLDKATVAAGGTVVATVTLTASSGQPVNNVKITVMSSDNSVVADTANWTNISGIAQVVIPVKMVEANKSIYLVAKAENVAQSTSLPLAVTSPKLSFNLPVTQPDKAFVNNYSGMGIIEYSGTTLKLLDGNGNPIPGQTISLYIDSITGKQADDQVVYNPVQGSMIIAPPGIFTGVTDSSGNVNVPMSVQMYCPPPPATGSSNHVITINWRVVAVYGGITFTLSGSSAQNITNTKA